MVGAGRGERTLDGRRQLDEPVDGDVVDRSRRPHGEGLVEPAELGQGSG
jgi:hypothetical protein